VRNARRAVSHDLEQAEKRHEINQGQLERAEKELEKLTADSIAEIDRMLEAKEKELMEV
jgi:ribosome recycling factor